MNSAADLKLQLSRKDFDLYFHNHPKQFQPPLQAALRSLCYCREVLQLYESLLKLTLLYMSGGSSAKCDQAVSKARRAYSSSLLVRGAELSDSHPYLLGIITYTICARLVENDYELTVQQLFDLHHTIHKTIFGVAVSDPYVTHFLGKCFPLQVALYQLESLRPQKKQAQKNKNVLSGYSASKGEKLAPELKEVEALMRSKGFEQGHRRKEGQMTSSLTNLARPKKPSKFQFNMIQLSASVKQQLKYQSIPFKTSQYICIKEAQVQKPQREEVMARSTSLGVKARERKDSLALLPNREAEAWKKMLHDVRNSEFWQASTIKRTVEHRPEEERIPKLAPRPLQPRRTHPLFFMEQPQTWLQCKPEELVSDPKPRVKVDFLSNIVVPEDEEQEQRRLPKKEAMALKRVRLGGIRKKLQGLFCRTRLD